MQEQEAFIGPQVYKSLLRGTEKAISAHTLST